MNQGSNSCVKLQFMHKPMQYSMIIQNIVSELDTMVRCTEQILELVCFFVFLFFVYKHALFTIRFILIIILY